MSVKNKTNKNNKRSQKGRSMVEMLGVLAIIGVLSVGGVYGYGVAMKKHKANELLHQASMQASSIAAQIASGKTDLALENFGNSSNGSFSSVKGPDGSTNYQSGDDKFTMQITDMDEAVCKQMQGMNGGMVRSVTCSSADANGKVTATLAYNKDLSSKPVASDYNSDTTGAKCTEAGYQWCDGKCKKDCCDGILCSGCQTCNSETGLCQNDDSKCEIGQECFSGSCMNSECQNEDCSCTDIGKASSECSSARPYCVMDEGSYSGKCVATAEGAPCWGTPSWCSGTDAKYCVDEGNICSKTPTNVFCQEDKDCFELGYCVNNKCGLIAEGMTCSAPSHCRGTDAPYCNQATSSCSKSPEGAKCNSASDCGELKYCLASGCASTALGAPCSSSSDCADTDAPFCASNGVCQSVKEEVSCQNEDCSCTDIGKASSECSSARPYCVMDEGSYSGKCVATAEGAPCWGTPSWCSGTDAKYCVDEGNICSKTPTNVFCQEDKDCFELGYCVNNKCVSG